MHSPPRARRSAGRCVGRFACRSRWPPAEFFATPAIRAAETRCRAHPAANSRRVWAHPPSSRRVPPIARIFDRLQPTALAESGHVSLAPTHPRCYPAIAHTRRACSPQPESTPTYRCRWRSVCRCLRRPRDMPWASCPARRAIFRRSGWRRCNPLQKWHPSPCHHAEVRRASVLRDGLPRTPWASRRLQF